MTKASDNAFPSLLITEGTEPSAPAAGKQRLYIDSTTHLVKVTNSSGTDSNVGAGAITTLITTDTAWAAKGNLVAGTANDTAAILSVGSNTQVLTADSGETTGLKWATPSAGSGGGLLAVQRYGPATTVLSTTSATLADADAANLAVTFTAPASGNVLVRVSLFCDETTGAAEFTLGLRESTSNIAAGIVARGTTGTGPPVSIPFYLTGVSGGSHTYKVSFASSAGGSTARIVLGPGAAAGDFPAGILEVWAAP